MPLIYWSVVLNQLPMPRVPAGWGGSVRGGKCEYSVAEESGMVAQHYVHKQHSAGQVTG